MFKKEDATIKAKKESLFHKIKPIVARELRVDENKITLASRVIDDLGADSLDVMELVMSLEEEFNIEILDEDIDKMSTVEDIIVYLCERVKI